MPQGLRYYGKGKKRKNVQVVTKILHILDLKERRRKLSVFYFS